MPERTSGSPPSPVRVTSVTFESFRGSHSRCLISFLDKGGSARSAVIFGENGSGKSTMVEALEFACQATVGRAKAWRSPQRPMIWNAASDSAAIAKVEFTSGASIERVLKRRSPQVSESVTTSQNGHIPEMRFAPLALKRSDITRFIDTPANERGLLLTDYFARTLSASAHGKFEGWSMADIQELAELQRSLQERRKRLADEVAGHLDNLRNRTPDYVVNEVKVQVFKGASPRDWEKSGVRVVLPRNLGSIAADLLEVDSKFRQARRDLSAARKAFNSQKNKVPYEFRRTASILTDILADISQHLTTSFVSITGARHVDSIWAEFGRTESTSLDLFVRLENGKIFSPQQIFSEGYLDLFVMLFYLAMAQGAAKYGQLKVLALDDVMQSVDAPVRTELMHYIIRDFAEWQLILTVHDRLWRQQVLDAFRAAKIPVVERRIRDWTFAGGPLADSERSVPEGPLRRATRDAEPSSICAEAGRLLELICDRLSWTLPVKVTRRREDLYTLGDLWPPVSNALLSTNARARVEQTQRWQFLRNQVGAHFNEWANSLSISDARRFAESVINLLDSVYCTKGCQTWISRSGSAWSCSCGATTLTRST